jgi:hypothetical protein
MLSSNSKSKSKSPKSPKSKSVKSIKSCYTYNDYINQLNGLGNILLQQYNNHIEATLNEENEHLLNEVSSSLQHMASINGIKFSKNKFKSFVKKIVFIQKGGEPDGDDNNHSLVPYERHGERDEPSKITTYAIIGFITSIILIYFAFCKFNDLTKKTIGTDIATTSDIIKTQKDATLIKLQKLPPEQYTFLKFVWTYFTDLGCMFVNEKTEDIINFVTELLKESMNEYMKIAAESCRYKYNIVDEKTPGAFIINPVTNFISSFVTKDTTYECYREVGRIQREKMMNDFKYYTDLYTNTILTDFKQIKDLLFYASRLGGSAVATLFGNILYRNRRIRRRTYRSLPPPPSHGGKKQTIKHKKYRKYKTNKKTNL